MHQFNYKGGILTYFKININHLSPRPMFSLFSRDTCSQKYFFENWLAKSALKVFNVNRLSIPYRKNYYKNNLKLIPWQHFCRHQISSDGNVWVILSCLINNAGLEDSTRWCFAGGLCLGVIWLHRNITSSNKNWLFILERFLTFLSTNVIEKQHRSKNQPRSPLG